MNEEPKTRSGLEWMGLLQLTEYAAVSGRTLRAWIHAAIASRFLQRLHRVHLGTASGTKLFQLFQVKNFVAIEAAKQKARRKPKGERYGKS
jgi:hypothetical protein